MAKRLCNLRHESIDKLTKRNTELEEYIKQLQDKMTDDLTNVTRNYLTFKAKYEHAKEICDMRKKKLQELREKFGEPEPTAAEAEPTESMQDAI